MNSRVSTTLEWLSALTRQGARGLVARVTVSREEYNEWLVPRPTLDVSITRGRNANKLELWGPGGSHVVILEETGDEDE